MKQDVSYYKEWIKTDLKNARMAYEQGQMNYIQWMLSLNQNLDRLYFMALVTDSHSTCEYVKTYREKQDELEKQVEEPQTKLLKNADELHNKLMKEL